jgi:hypothetical protein
MPATSITLAIATAALQITSMTFASFTLEGFLTAAVVADLVATHTGAVAIAALQFARSLTMVAIYLSAA